MRTKSLAAAMLTACLLPIPLNAADDATSTAKKENVVDAQACFDQLKKLEGEWVGHRGSPGSEKSRILTRGGQLSRRFAVSPLQSFVI